MAGLDPAIDASSFRRKPESSSAERANNKLDPGFAGATGDDWMAPRDHTEICYP